MWEFIARIILRNRIPILVLLALITGFMVYMAKYVEVDRGFPKILPEDSDTFIQHEDFKKIFNEEDGSAIVLGVNSEELFEVKNFNAWYELGNDLRAIDGIDSVFSVAHLYNLHKSDTAKRFEVRPIVNGPLASQTQVDSVKEVIQNLPFYHDLLYNDSAKASAMVLVIDPAVFNSEDRKPMMKKLIARADQFGQQYLTVHYSGFPYIRSMITILMESELGMFIVLAALITSIILYIFFRSFKVVVFTMLVVGVAVAWSFGFFGILGYKLTVLMAIIPPLLIVIGVPNCIFLLNKYQREYSLHGNKIKALTRMIQKIGNATFLTNTTTAMGFATFIFTQSRIMVEFGISASINIMTVFLVSLLLIPIVFSFLPPPKAKHTKHLEKKWINNTVEKLVGIVTGYRTMVYLTTVALIVVSIFGIRQMKVSGNFVEDVPRDHQVYKDLMFFENGFNGVMPFEIVIDTRKEGHATKSSNLKKLEKLQELLGEYTQFSRSLSIADGMKFAKQAFYNGNPKKYKLVGGNEKSFIAPYLQGNNGEEEQSMMRNFVDTARQKTRVSVAVQNMDAYDMKSLLADVSPKIDSIFTPDKYDVTITGGSIVYMRSTEYLVQNLFISLGLAIFIIALIMAVLFRSFRMVAASFIPNLVPLVFTAAIMGYFGIPIKPSTILVFSIAFGISVDDTIHYLAKYRQELKAREWDIKGSVLNALRETGVSMIYTSVVLFFGFGIFMASQFGGTFAIGVLVSVTLLVAMLANLVLLPSLLLSLEKAITTKAFKEPLLEIIDEEEDIELEDLEVQEGAGEDTKPAVGDLTKSQTEENDRPSSTNNSTETEKENPEEPSSIKA